MKREQIEAQIKEQRETIAVVEFQLKLPQAQRDGKKTGAQLAADRQKAKRRITELEKWLASGFFIGGGGVAPSAPSRSVR